MTTTYGGYLSKPDSRIGWGDDHESLTTNLYQNPFWNSVALFKTSGDHAARVVVVWHGATGHAERGSFYGDRLSYIMGRPENSPNTVITQYEKPGQKFGIYQGSNRIEVFEQPNHWEKLPEQLRVKTVHGGSHAFITHEFVDAIVNDRMPIVDAWEAVAYTAPGIIAHQSAIRRGELLKIPDFGRAPDTQLLLLRRPSREVSLAASRRFFDWSLLVVCNLIWSSYFVMVKLVQDQMGPLFATTFPILIGTSLLLIFLSLRSTGHPGHPEWKTLSKADCRDYLLIGIFGQATTQFFGVWGGQLSPASSASLIMLALPIVTGVMAFLIRGERMTTLRWLGFALSIAGVAICSDIGRMEIDVNGVLPLLVSGMLFLSVLASAFYNVYSKRLLRRRAPTTVLLWSYGVALVALLPPTAFIEPEGFYNVPNYTLQVWVGLFVLAVLFYFLSMTIFLTVLTRLDATQAGLSNYMIPFFGVVLAALVLGERLQAKTLLGGVLILVATLT